MPPKCRQADIIGVGPVTDCRTEGPACLRHLAQSPPAQMKVIVMTTTQPRRSFTHRLTAPFHALRHLNWDPTGLGEAISPASRVPQPRPQPDLAEAKRVHPASAGKAPVGV